MDPKQISFSHLCHSPLDSGYCIFLLFSSKISFVIGTFIFKASSLQTTARPKETSSTAPVWGLEVNRREDTGTGLLGTGEFLQWIWGKAQELTCEKLLFLDIFEQPLSRAKWLEETEVWWQANGRTPIPSSFYLGEWGERVIPSPSAML